MSAIDKIKADISKLSPEEMAQLTKWLAQYKAEQVIKAAKAENLQHLWDEAEADIAIRKAKPLDKLFNQH